MGQKAGKQAPKTVKICCAGSGSIPISELTPFQGDLKSLSDENYEKLKKEILELGFSEPISVWMKGGKALTLNGHQRARTLQRMADEGYKIPAIPISQVEASSEKQAKLKVLALTSQYGEMTAESLSLFLDEADINLDEAMESFRFPEVDFNEMFGGDPEGDGDGDEYATKIEVPIYEPTGEKPGIEDLYDGNKTSGLKEEIDKADIPEDEKAFLRAAAGRHNVFNYEKIANYYAQSSPEIQGLMEKSALVIIDFDKAVEQGFVNLSDELVEKYAENSEIYEDRQGT